MYSKVEVALQEKKGSIKTILWGSWPQLVRRKYNKIHLKWNKTQAGDIAFFPQPKLLFKSQQKVFTQLQLTIVLQGTGRTNKQQRSSGVWEEHRSGFTIPELTAVT